VNSSTSSSSQEASRSRRYLGVLAIAVAVLAGNVAIPNILTDPYWYFGGGWREGLRYPFMTREAKLNRLQGEETAYDCLISGSSRALTLDPRAFQNHRCFNLAVEGTTLPESAELAARFAKVIPSPAIIIQSVDRFDFETAACRAGQGKAEAARAQQSAPWFQRYFSPDILRFSRRLTQDRITGIGYDSRWSPVFDRHGTYAPRWATLGAALAAHPSGVPSNREYTRACFSAVDELRRLFPTSQLTGYVSPISADIVLRIFVEGELETYLATIHDIAQRFDAFYDFAFPSALTLGSDATWDGSHFDPSISEPLAATLEGREEGPALPVHRLSKAQYTALYRAKIADLIAQLPERAEQERPHTVGAPLGAEPPQRL